MFTVRVYGPADQALVLEMSGLKEGNWLCVFVALITWDNKPAHQIIQREYKHTTYILKRTYELYSHVDDSVWFCAAVSFAPYNNVLILHISAFRHCLLYWILLFRSVAQILIKLKNYYEKNKQVFAKWCWFSLIN